jgi:hypothetical protein
LNPLRPVGRRYGWAEVRALAVFQYSETIFTQVASPTSQGYFFAQGFSRIKFGEL